MEQRQAGRDFGTNPLTGQPYFSSFVFKKEKAPNPNLQVLDIPLYLAPSIPLRSMRALGVDGGINDDIPQFLLERGAARNNDPKTGAERLLFACDLILHQPRVALSANIFLEAGPLTGRSTARQVLTTRQPIEGDVLRVYSGQYMPPSADFDPLQEVYEEQPWDERLISTVYLLSPPATRRGSKPDGQWQPFVKHALSDNLNWIPAPLLRPLDLADTPNPLSGLGAIGGGLLLPIVNTFAAATNDLAQMVLDEITARSQAGTWWTPTGGGHVTLLPPREQTQAGGLNKAARLAARRADAIANRPRPARLDPPYPFGMVGFNPSRLHSLL